MARNAAQTKQRILDAATAEFATHGMAGARVDRIAQDAGSNKQLIYAYFGSKQGLFEAMVDAHIDHIVGEIPLTADDLPGYAGQLFDYALSHPDMMRLMQWLALEGTNANGVRRSLLSSMEEKVVAIAEAQARGTVDDALNPQDLLVLIYSISCAWAAGPFGTVSDVAGAGQGRQRAAAMEAVHKLVRRVTGPV